MSTSDERRRSTNRSRGQIDPSIGGNKSESENGEARSGQDNGNFLRSTTDSRMTVSPNLSSSS